MGKIVIRRIEPDDLPALTAIYNHYIVNTAATFDLQPYTLVQRQAWFASFAPVGRYQCFVAARDGVALGWASSGRLRVKAAYDTSVETSVYLAPGEEGQGIGRQLYRTLFEALVREDIHRAYALVTLPNDASVALHLATDFVHIGTMTESGRKLSRFWDVGWFERAVFPGMSAGNPSGATNPLL
jgi:phosphinothricin acetyltransferase